MEHNRLSIEEDEGLVNKIFENVEMRYILLYLYVIRNDLLKNLTDASWLNSFHRIMELDEILKSDLERIVSKEMIELLVDLRIIRNVRSTHELHQKDVDFEIKVLEPITIEENTIIVPEDTLFAIISKRFKFFTKRNFHEAITRLKGVMCERGSIIHPFIFEVGKQNYVLSDDLYEILDDLGNPYQTIKVETTIGEFYNRFQELLEKIEGFLDIFDSFLNKKPTTRCIKEALEKNKDILDYLKENIKKIPEKFDLEEVDDKDNETFKNWLSTLLNLLTKRNRLMEIDENLKKIKNIFSGKGKKYTYIEFITRVSYNEDNILNDIKEKLVELREELISIKNEFSEIESKEIKLLNLDYERFLLMNE